MSIVINRVQESLLEILGSLVQLLPGIVLALAILLMTAYGARITRRIADRVSGQFVKSRSLQILTLQTVRIGTWVLGILLAAIVAFPGLQLGDIIALLGLGSVAIGFAFQDIFKNFLAGILLLLEEPFRLGDQIIVSDYEGTVETVNIRFTKLRTYMGEVIEIPNSIVFTSAVKVLTANDCRRTDLDIGVDYTTPLPLAQRTFLETVEQVEGVLSEPAPEVDCVGFGDSSINFKVRFWTAPQIAEVRRAQSRVAIALKAACDEANITIPYPIRTVHYFDQQKFNESEPYSETDLGS
ncbi:mechanosensitive ion channel family protein [Vacuolonema iberomarrocanum]|uniref:mechanosensitive ion channel family protein n=1 Tax=Vacuolonema iberomarrocanum TaxID=3454632 RepID=UPI0019F602B4|nr:mechanosensitive ion channel family protein [filamentous cyanobacterium LEGE 07170]